MGFCARSPSIGKCRPAIVTAPARRAQAAAIAHRRVEEMAVMKPYPITVALTLGVALAGPAVAAEAAAAGAAPARGDVPRHARIDAELAADLAGWAQRFSGLARPAGVPLPALQPLAEDELARTVCPQQPSACRGIVAAYDTTQRRIVYRHTLDMREPMDQSFIVHELTHWLQHLQRGSDLEDSCASVIAAERQAYAAQNRYLDHFRQWQRAGEMLRFTFCPEDRPGGPHGAEPSVRFDASTGPITLPRAPVPAPAATPGGRGGS
jgi:hypothetical protein